jgi:separase
MLADLRTTLENIFQRALRHQKRKAPAGIRLDDALIECFSRLPPDCRDEELEDLVYFILDLYQFHGVAVAIAEVDVSLVTVELQMALESHAAKVMAQHISEEADSHMFLVLDKNVQSIPWESIPILRGRSVSRIPSMEFLLDRLQLASWKKDPETKMNVDRASVDPRKVYYVLNPSNDLRGTEERYRAWLKEMRRAGWDGVVGKPPSEQQLLDALSRKDLVMCIMSDWFSSYSDIDVHPLPSYFGHGGAEQYVRSHRLRNLPRCATVMLWGCSSGVLREMGDFDRVGTPYNYMLAGW